MALGFFVLISLAALGFCPGVEGDRVRRGLGFNTVGNCAVEDVINPLLCNSSFGQAYVDLYTECGLDDLAQAVVDACRTHSNGSTCEFITRFSNIGPYEIDVRFNAKCPSSLSSCPAGSGCNDSLDALISVTECCYSTLDLRPPDPLLVSFYDFEVGLDRFIGSLQPFNIPRRIWLPLPELCGIDTPSVCLTQSSLTLNPASGSCSQEELEDRYITDVVCVYESQKPLLDVYDSCQADNFRDGLVDFCSVNSEGQLCQLIRNNVTDQDRLLDIADKCDGYNDTYCPDACPETLESYQSDFGCCITVLLNDTDNVPLDVLSFDLWSVCGVETVGECKSTLQEPPTTEPTTEPTSMTTSGGPVEAVAATELLIIMTLLLL